MDPKTSGSSCPLGCSVDLGRKRVELPSPTARTVTPNVLVVKTTIVVDDPLPNVIGDPAASV